MASANIASVLPKVARERPYAPKGTRRADAAWLAMPRSAIDLVAQARAHWASL